MSLSCQHVERVTQALRSSSGGGWAGHAQLVIYWLAHPTDAIHVRKASETYAQVSVINIGLNLLLNAEQDYAAPTLFVAVRSLPKSALIEKQVLWHTGRCPIADEDEPTWQSRVPFTDRGKPFNVIKAHSLIVSPGDIEDSVHWEVSCFQDSSASCAAIFVKGSGKHSFA